MQLQVLFFLGLLALSAAFMPALAPRTPKTIVQGRGDRRTKAGKRFVGSNGKSRPVGSPTELLYKARATGKKVRVGGPVEGGDAAPAEASE